MHPIERLRYVARAAGGGEMVVREAAGALAGFADDPPGLVTASRRMVGRHPTSGPMWWLAARVLTSPDPAGEAWEAVRDHEDDPTPREVAAALPADATCTLIGWPMLGGQALRRRGDLSLFTVDAAGEWGHILSRLERFGIEATEVPESGTGQAILASDLLLLECEAAGPDGFVAPAGSRAAAAAARHGGVPVWLVCGVGRVLPASMWKALLRSFEEDNEPWERADEVVPLDLVDIVIGPVGVRDTTAMIRSTDCPVAPELLKPLAAPGTA